MFKEDGVQWLTLKDIAEILDPCKALTPFPEGVIPYRDIDGKRYYRSLEICDLYGINDRCHACLTPISGRAVNTKFCSRECRNTSVAAMEEINTFAIINTANETIAVAIDDYLMQSVRKFALSNGIPIQSAIRSLLFLGMGVENAFNH